MEILGKILNSPARVKIMRLFLSNKSKVFSNKDIAGRSRINTETIRRELKLLESVDFVKKRVTGWAFNSFFKFTKEFENLLISSDTLDKEAITTCFKKVGRVRLIIVSGVFIKNKASRVDLLLVGDKMNKSKIQDGIRKIEAEMGVEITYATFTTKDFIYRLNMRDKLVRDILDFPNEVIFQAKELSTQSLKKA